MRAFVVVLCSLFFAASGRGANRVALVSADRGDEVRNVLALAEVKLGQEKGIELLERGAIDRVLAEQKLALTGLVEASQAIAVGKLLSVDLFAVVEATPQTKEALGLVVFDAATGARLSDEALSSTDPDKAADAVAAGIRAAAEKRASAAKNLRTVGLLTVRNADLPQEMDSLAEAIALILERGLVRSSNIAVLERKRLEQVNREKALPKQPSDPALWGSLVLMELDVGRARTGSGLRLTVLLSDSTGKQLEKVAAEVADVNAASAVTALLPGVRKALSAAPPAGANDPHRESQRFAREARLLLGLPQPAQALRAAECAQALDPADHQALLSQALLVYATSLLDERGMNVMQRRRKVPEERLVPCLRIAQRGLDLRSHLLDRLAASHLLGPRHNDVPGPAQAAFDYLTILATVDVPPPQSEAGPLWNGIYESVTQVALKQLGWTAEAARKNARLLAEYTYQLTSMLALSPLSNIRDSASYVRKVTPIVETWVADSRRPEILGEDSTLAISRFMPALLFMPEDGNRTGLLSPKEYGQLDHLYQSMETHTHPLVRLCGRAGRLWVAQATGQSTPAQTQERFQELKKQAQEVIEHGKQGENLRLGCYQFIGLAVKRLLPKDDKLRFQEYVALCEFMIARQELVQDVATQALYYHGGGLEKRKLELIERLLALVDSPRCQYWGYTKRSNFRPLLEEYRHGLEDRTAKSPGAKPAAPWTRVRTLLSAMPAPGREAFVRPVIAGDQVYTVACGRKAEPGAYFFEVLRVPLDGSRPRRMGSATVRKPDNTYTDWRGFIGAFCLGAGQAFVGSSEGIYCFPLERGKLRLIAEADGLPAPAVEALAVLDRKLYAALKGGYIVAYDLDTRHCEVLASSRRKENRSPFDDSQVFAVYSLLADPERHRLLFLVERQGAGHEKVDGLWILDADKNTFQQRQRMPVNWFSWASPIRDGHVFLSGQMESLADYDLARDSIQFLWNPPANAPLAGQPAPLKGTFDTWPPFLYREGKIWTGRPLGTLHIASGRREVFPLLIEQDPFPRFASPLGCFEFLDHERRLLIANELGMWLAELNPEVLSRSH
jgi:tetratricopeptide (TPR) repeat protein